MKIAVLAGDGIGPEIIAQAVRVLDVLKTDGLAIELESGLIGGCAVDATGNPYPEATHRLASQADAVLLGASGMTADGVFGYSPEEVAVKTVFLQ